MPPLSQASNQCAAVLHMPRASTRAESDNHNVAAPTRLIGVSGFVANQSHLPLAPVLAYVLVHKVFGISQRDGKGKAARFC